MDKAEAKRRLRVAAGPWIEGSPPRTQGKEWLIEIDEKDESIPLMRMVAWWEGYFKKWQTSCASYPDKVIVRHAEIYIGGADDS